MKIQTVSIIVIICVAATAALTKFYFPNVEYKNTETVKEVVRNDIRTVVREVTKKDGTKEIITETTDKSVKKEDHNKTIQKNEKSKYLVGLGFEKTTRGEQSYEVMAGMRVMGPVFGLVKVRHGDRDSAASLGIAIEF